ncbi:hypothetical protein J6590_047187 [Homalodisca vitripennis]|nr:hypothetical protein J6590_047187 [Homalodisca vitripennis]
MYKVGDDMCARCSYINCSDGTRLWQQLCLVTLSHDVIIPVLSAEPTTALSAVLLSTQGHLPREHFLFALECSAANRIKCTVCEHRFHLHCAINYSEEKTMRPTEGLEVNHLGINHLLIGDFLIEVMEGFKNDVIRETASFKAEIAELSMPLDTYNVVMEDIKKSLLKYRNLEKHTRVSNIDISGVLESRGENITDVGAALGPEVGRWTSLQHTLYCHTETTGAVCHRPVHGQEDQERKSLTARYINQNFSAQHEFVKDHLSLENKQFLSKLKQKVRENKFVCCRDGKLFARKAEGLPVKK